MSRPRPHARALALALAVAALAAGCAGAPARRPLPDVRWPAETGAARVRLAAVFPDPDAPRPRVSTWRRVLDFVVGREGDAPDRWLVRPFGVTAAADGFYVADPDAAALVRVTGASAERVGCKAEAWGAPMAVAVAGDGTVYVADAARAVVVAIDPTGTCRMLGAGELERPVAVAVDAARLFVADPPSHRIVVLSRDGRVLARWGALGTGDGEFHYPTGVTLARDGTLLVVDAMNFRIVRLTSGGEWIGAFGAAGDAGGDLASPKAVAAAADGRIFVTDARRDAVLVFDGAGRFEYAIGATGSAPGHLAHPAGVAVAGGRVLVADSMNHRIQVFEILGDRS